MSSGSAAIACSRISLGELIQRLLFIVALEQIVRNAVVIAVTLALVLMARVNRLDRARQLRDSLASKLVPADVQEFQIFQVRTCGQDMSARIGDATMTDVQHFQSPQNARLNNRFAAGVANVREAEP